MTPTSCSPSLQSSPLPVRYSRCVRSSPARRGAARRSRASSSIRSSLPVSRRGCSSRSSRGPTTFPRDRCCRRCRFTTCCSSTSSSTASAGPTKAISSSSRRPFRRPTTSSSASSDAPATALRISGGTVYLNGAALDEPYVAEKPAYDLEIRDYGIYVSYGVGWQRLDPSSANVPPRLRLDRTGPDSAALLHHARRQSQRFGGFARLGLRAGSADASRPGRARRRRRLYRPRLPDLLAALASQDSVGVCAKSSAWPASCDGGRSRAWRCNSPCSPF